MTASPKTIFIPFLHAFGGVERLALGLSRFLHEQGCAHSIVCFDQTIDLASTADWPLQVRELKPRRNPWAESRSLAAYLRKEAAQGAPPALIFDLNGAFYAGLLAPRGYVLHLTDPPSLLPSDVSKNALSLRKYRSTPRNRSRWMKSLHAEGVHRLNRRGVHKAAAVVVMTDVIADEISRLYQITAQIVRPGVAPQPKQAPRSLAMLGNGQLRLLSVCRLEGNKRIDWILHALAALDAETAEHPQNWELDVVGDGTQADFLRNLAQQLGLSQKVVFHGQVSDEKLREIYADAHLFLMPAVQGYGLPALEALSAGLPVILHRESGVAEILGDTPWAEVIDNAPNSLGLALNRMIDRLRDGSFKRLAPPEIPTETEWARQICRICGWIPPEPI